MWLRSARVSMTMSSLRVLSCMRQQKPCGEGHNIVQGGAKTWDRVRRGAQGVAPAAGFILASHAVPAQQARSNMPAAGSKVGSPGRNGSCVPPGRLQSP
jgi:hypothetical protein